MVAILGVNWQTLKPPKRSVDVCNRHEDVEDLENGEVVAVLAKTWQYLLSSRLKPAKSTGKAVNDHHLASNRSIEPLKEENLIIGDTVSAQLLDSLFQPTRLLVEPALGT